MHEQPHDYALVIGLNDYPGFGSRGRPLAGAIGDAERFAAWLTNTELGGGLPEGNCTLLRSTADPLGPSQHIIDLELGALLKRARIAGGRRLYFYFSGHGQAWSSTNVALCLSHWSPDMYRNAALSSELYRDVLLRCSPFSEIVVLLDCCRVLSVGAAGAESDIGCAMPATDAKGSMVAYAAQFQNPAMEATQGAGGARDEEGAVVRGHFTTGLLAALNGAAARAQGGVTATALKRYLEVNVPRIAQRHQHIQDARVMLDFAEDDQPIFGCAMPAANYRIAFSPQRTGSILLEGGNGLQVIQEGDASTGPWDVVLQPGLHRLEERGTGQEKYLRCEPAGGIVDVLF